MMQTKRNANLRVCQLSNRVSAPIVLLSSSRLGEDERTQLKDYIFQLSNSKPLMREKWLMLLVTRTRLLMIAIEATRISASEMIAPSPLSAAYMSAAFTITSSVIWRTILALQNKIKASTCLCAFFALSPFSIHIVQYVRW